MAVILNLLSAGRALQLKRCMQELAASCIDSNLLRRRMCEVIPVVCRWRRRICHPSPLFVLMGSTRQGLGASALWAPRIALSLSVKASWAALTWSCPHSENGFFELTKHFCTCTNEIFVAARKFSWWQRYKFLPFKYSFFSQENFVQARQISLKFLRKNFFGMVRSIFALGQR